jgi:hypothetical protein
MTSSSESNEVVLLIAEFNALRAEILDNFNTARSVASIYLAAVGAVGLAAVSGNVSPNIIVVVPIVTALFWWVHLDTRMVVSLIGVYLRHLSSRAQELASSSQVFSWEEFQRGDVRKKPAYFPLRVASALDGLAWPLYTFPAALALFLTRRGASEPLKIYAERSTGEEFLFPVWLWWAGAVSIVVVSMRAHLTEGTYSSPHKVR